MAWDDTADWRIEKEKSVFLKKTAWDQFVDFQC